MINVGRFSATRSDLVEFTMRHKGTLKRLALTDMYLNGEDADWERCLSAIAGDLPHLQRVRLRGNFTIFWAELVDVEDFAFGDPWKFKYSCASPWVRAMERWVKYGGQMPEEDYDNDDEGMSDGPITYETDERFWDSDDEVDGTWD
ncbi:hypothetical protein H2203_005672 [Taxawa tesnikishii (nom. ined.)]|nr:hypothetical protein H2203_005672 [Dothideales sp. JES 119]